MKANQARYSRGSGISWLGDKAAKVPSVNCTALPRRRPFPQIPTGHTRILCRGTWLESAFWNVWEGGNVAYPRTIRPAAGAVRRLAADDDTPSWAACAPIVGT